MQSKQPIFITGVERSGSTLVARVLQFCGANVGRANKMRENESLRALTHLYISRNSADCFMPDLKQVELPLDWNEQVLNKLKKQYIPETMPFMFKHSGLAQTYPLWHQTYPNAKWIIVRRRTGDIIHSCCETNYMIKFKNKTNQGLVGATNEKEGWLWWVRQYEELFREMHEAGLNYKVVWPERMRDGDFDQMKEVADWCDLTWNEELIPTIQGLLH